MVLLSPMMKIIAMKFKPKSLEDNVNVSKTHPLREFAWLLGGLFLILATIYIVLGLLTDIVVAKTPVNIETWLGQHALKGFDAQKSPALQNRLDKLLSKVPHDSPLLDYTYTVYLSKNKEINALALPGGNIVVFQGLLKNIKSENELAMVLCHELGHFAERDQLRGLGRGLGLTVASIMMFGTNSGASEVISKSLLSFQARYSQSQESAADRFGLELLVANYGHAGGATDFFERLNSRGESKIPYLLASHPHPQDRIDQLNRIIEVKDYPVRQVMPLARKLSPKRHTK